MKKILKHIIVCIFVLLVSFFLVDYFICKSKLNKIETIQNNMPISYPFHLCQVTGYHSEGQYLVVETVREGTNINFVILIAISANAKQDLTTGKRDSSLI